MSESKRGFFKGYLVTGAKRLALLDHASALDQLNKEALFLKEVVSACLSTCYTSEQYNQATGLQDKIAEEKRELIHRFIENWLKET